MNVYTYFQPLTTKGIWRADDQRKLISVWRRSWKKHGWTPVVLDENSARAHPRYREFKEKFWSLPTEYGHDYEGACMLRYAAVAAQKQSLSMMTDYDVINYGFTPAQAEALSKKSGPRLLFLSEPNSAAMGATIGPWELFEGFAQILFQWVPDQHDWNNSATFNGYHCSDNSMAARMRFGTYHCPGWAQWEEGQVIWGHPGWEKSPLVHYGFEMKHAGHWPKWKHIDRLRLV